MVTKAFILNLWICKVTSEVFLEYEIKPSHQIALDLKKLHRNFPDFAFLSTAQETFNLPAAGTDNDCMFDPDTLGCNNYFLTIYDSLAHPEDSDSYNYLPEVFLSGALHGNERVGPTAVLETATLLLEAAQCESLPNFTSPPNKVNSEEVAEWQLQLQEAKSCRKTLRDRGINASQRKWLARLVTTRRIVVSPMTNALGYDRNQRTEDGIDPNRDFPFDVRNVEDCMQTIAGRTVNELFRQHLFQMSLTFHAGTEVVGYEWGAFPYLHNLSPDDTAQMDISEGYSMFAGSFKGTPSYATGTMNDLVYAVHGGMEDWAYAGSWIPDKVPKCNPTTYGGYDPNKCVYNESMLRTFNMLIETSNSKIPKTHLGTSNGILSISQNPEANGHISRNIRLALLAIELVEPYISIWGVNDVPLENDVVPAIERTNRKYSKSNVMGIPHGQNEAKISWYIGGGFNVSFTRIIYAKWEDVPSIIDGAHQPFDVDFGRTFRTTEATNGPTRWKKGWQDGTKASAGWNAELTGEPLFQATIDLSSFQPGDEIAIFATARLDQDWMSEPDGIAPQVPPMSHVVNARTNPGWRHESAGKVVQGRLDWYSIPLTLLISDEIENIVDLSDRLKQDQSVAEHDNQGVSKEGSSIDEDLEEPGGYSNDNFEVHNNFSDLLQNETRTIAKDKAPVRNVLLATTISLIGLLVLSGILKFRNGERRERLIVIEDHTFDSEFTHNEEIQLREMT